MKYNRVISTAVLFLLLGTTLPAFAQKGEEEKGGGGGKPQPAQHQAQPQRAQPAKAQPQRAQAQPQRAQPAKATAATRTSATAARPAREGAATTRTSATAARPAAQRRSHNAHKRNSPPGSRHRPLLATVAAANMAAFLTPITVPISVMATRSTWGVPR